MSGGIPAWAAKGAKVVCWTEKYFSEDRPHPKEREACTIKSTDTLDGWPIFWLVEYRQPFIGMVFRPAVEDKDDGEIEARLFRKHRLESPVSQRLLA